MLKLQIPHKTEFTNLLALKKDSSVIFPALYPQTRIFHYWHSVSSFPGPPVKNLLPAWSPYWFSSLSAKLESSSPFSAQNQQSSNCWVATVK